MALALVLAPLVFALVAALMALGGVTQAYRTINDMFTGRQVMRTDQPAVINQIQQLSRLETSSYTIEKVIEGGVQQDNPLLNTLLGDRLLFIAHGEVLAGVDLTEMQEGDITVGADQDGDRPAAGGADPFAATRQSSRAGSTTGRPVRSPVPIPTSRRRCGRSLNGEILDGCLPGWHPGAGQRQRRKPGARPADGAWLHAR